MEQYNRYFNLDFHLLICRDCHSMSNTCAPTFLMTRMIFHGRGVSRFIFVVVGYWIFHILSQSRQFCNNRLVHKPLIRLLPQNELFTSGLLGGYGRELTHFLVQVATNISTPPKACSKRGRLTCTQICLVMGREFSIEIRKQPPLMETAVFVEWYQPLYIHFLISFS